MTKKRVVVTGASGYIVQRMWSELAERYDIVALDNRETTSEFRHQREKRLKSAKHDEFTKYRRISGAQTTTRKVKKSDNMRLPPSPPQTTSKCFA